MNAVKGYRIAQHIMSKEPVCAEPSMTIRQLARLLEENEISGCPVSDAEGRVIGVVSRTDLVRCCTEGTRDYSPGALFGVLSDESDDVIPEPTVRVEDFMSEGAATVSPNTALERVAALMVERRIHRVVVVDRENFPLGIITSLDLLGAFPASAETKESSGRRVPR
jgi:CBS domain-containing protein